VVLHELAKHDGARGYDLGGTIAFVVGLTGLVLAVSRGGLSGWNDPIVIGGFIAAGVLLPTWVVIEHRGRAPMLDLGIFADRMFAAASVATFINGLVRFALMFIFVFYFQGAQGDSPVTAGLKLSALAVGMLIASPLAGRYADRHGSRLLAGTGMLVTAAGLAAMTQLEVGSSFVYSAAALAVVGIGSGMFMSPNTAAMMGAVAPHRRGVAAGARMVLMNTGSILSIAFVLAVVTSAVPKATLFRIFSGLGHGLSSAKLEPFIANMHVALWAMAAASIVGALVSIMRPAHRAS
jgi:MFS family permease